MRHIDLGKEWKLGGAVFNPPKEDHWKGGTFVVPLKLK
jgi:hypothetical protein